MNRFDQEAPVERRLLHDLGYCGHYLHVHSGGRSGKPHILCKLYKNGGEMSQRELGEQFDIKPGSLSEVLAKVEGEGLIERTRDEGDHRQLNVRLTEEGSARACELSAAKKQFEGEAFACLSPEERMELLGLLDRVRTSWEELA